MCVYNAVRMQRLLVYIDIDIDRERERKTYIYIYIYIYICIYIYVYDIYIYIYIYVYVYICIYVCIYIYMLIRRNPPPRGVFLFGWFPNEEPGQRGPLAPGSSFGNHPKGKPRIYIY